MQSTHQVQANETERGVAVSCSVLKLPFYWALMG